MLYHDTGMNRLFECHNDDLLCVVIFLFPSAVAEHVEHR